MIINQISKGGGDGTYQSKTVMPDASGFVVTPDAEYDALSQVTVNGDADLVAANIKNGVEIFGVTGTYEGSGQTSIFDPYETLSVSDYISAPTYSYEIT